MAPTLVVLEACGASHPWGRVLGALGHEVRPIPAQYVRPFVRRGKTDRADAEAICTAAGQPGMSFVPVKSLERQAEAMLLGVRGLLAAVAASPAAEAVREALGLLAAQLALLARKPRKLAAVALANTLARIAWAMMTRGEAYRRPLAP